MRTLHGKQISFEKFKSAQAREDFACRVIETTDDDDQSQASPIFTWNKKDDNTEHVDGIVNGA